jgi:hypothetical protein
MKRLLLIALFLFGWLGCAYAAPILHTGTADPCTSNDNKSYVAISTTSAIRFDRHLRLPFRFQHCRFGYERRNGEA